MEPLKRCGRFGHWPLAGDVIQYGDEVLVVVASTFRTAEKLYDPVRCPVDGCSEWVEFTTRPADDEEAINFLEEQARIESRRAWYEELVRERRAAYLASRGLTERA